MVIVMRRTLPAIVHLGLGDEMLVWHMSPVVEGRGEVGGEGSRLVVGQAVGAERVP
jgi:hypothetical protein